jgi:hypothetical protein
MAITGRTTATKADYYGCRTTLTSATLDNKRSGVSITHPTNYSRKRSGTKGNDLHFEHAASPLAK